MRLSLQRRLQQAAALGRLAEYTFLSYYRRGLKIPQEQNIDN